MWFGVSISASSSEKQEGVADPSQAGVRALKDGSYCQDWLERGQGLGQDTRAGSDLAP